MQRAVSAGLGEQGRPGIRCTMGPLPFSAAYPTPSPLHQARGLPAYGIVVAAITTLKSAAARNSPGGNWVSSCRKVSCVPESLHISPSGLCHLRSDCTKAKYSNPLPSKVTSYLVRATDETFGRNLTNCTLSCFVQFPANAWATTWLNIIEYKY